MSPLAGMAIGLALYVIGWTAHAVVHPVQTTKHAVCVVKHGRHACKAK